MMKCRHWIRAPPPAACQRTHLLVPAEQQGERQALGVCPRGGVGSHLNASQVGVAAGVGPAVGDGQRVGIQLRRQAGGRLRVRVQCTKDKQHAGKCGRLSSTLGWPSARGSMTALTCPAPLCPCPTLPWRCAWG